ncbi:protein FAR-RED IMPAIRED RESPONSE 1-like [Silene latifolia]|uniref:protein FAR-RED IMPAIRED RESPONSE 1-like n=1 Tax=Silene latifolia TaxID=37657 RepID=UPI003D77BFC8
MVFVPFTGVDHHKRCITFGAALLADEGLECYTWLFNIFLEAMGGHHPIIIITDQDKSTKSVIPQVFEESTHRLCMWHIINKLREKVSYQLFQDEDFKRRLNRFLSSQMTLVEFWMCFESVMEEERHKQSKLNSDNKHSQIPLKTKLNLEVHASEIYTHTIFKDFQTELVAALFQCGLKDVENIDNTKVFILKDSELPNKTWNIAYSLDNNDVTYGRAIDVSQLYSDRKSLTTELWQEVYSCVSLAEYNEEDMKFLIEKLRDIRLDITDKRSFPANKKDKMKEMEKYVGFKRPNKLVIQLPTKSKKKGRVRGKRIESHLLKALKKRATENRYCKICGRQGHSSRTCKETNHLTLMYIFISC